MLTDKDEAKKEEKRQEALKSTKQRFLDVFESLIQASGGKHLVGSSLTWADLYLAHAINHVELGHGIQLLNELPGVKNLCENVMTASPGIKTWLDKRPKTKF